MPRSNLSSWFGLTYALLIICILAHDVEMKLITYHVGILETRQNAEIEREYYEEQHFINNLGEGSITITKDNDYYILLQCSYALSALQHLELIEEFLYGSDDRFKYVSNYDYILFDAEVVSMLATVHNLPLHEHLRGILWTLWFYTVRVHRLLEAPSEGRKVQFMFKAHQAIKRSLRFFLHKTRFENVQRKLKDIETEKISDEHARIEVLLANKKRLNDQMAFNNLFEVPTAGKEHISFETLTNLHKSNEVGSIVVKYYGQNYWTIVETKLREMYVKAMSLDVTLSYQVLYLWHIKNSIMTILKGVLNRFVKKYLDFSVNPRDSSDPNNRPDKVIITKLTEYCECIGRSSEMYDTLKESRGSISLSDFYVGVKRDIKKEKDFYPLSTNIEDISDFYFLLSNETNMTIMTETEEWQNIDAFIEKVKTLFSDVSMDVIKSFDMYPILSQSFECLKRNEYQ